MRVIAAVALGVALLGCSGVTSSPTATPTVTPPATATPSAVPPTTGPTTAPTIPPTPVPATPTPSVPPVGWSGLIAILESLGLDASADLPLQTDATADATTADGGAGAEISADLDITAWFAGWARLSSDLFVGDGPLSCDRDEVQCTNDPLPPSDETAIVVAIRVSDVIRLGDSDREASFGVALSRPGFEDSPSDRGGYSDADLVFVAGLNAGEFSAIEWESEGWHFAPRRGGEARVVVAGDTMLFVLPNDRSERPNGRVVSFERIPPSDISGNADAIDVAVDLDSFFDIDYELNDGD